MAAAEFAVHTYDLTMALGRATASLDPEVAEVGLAFLTSSLTEDMRGDEFGHAQSAPANADAYQRIAAFARRSVWTRRPTKWETDTNRGHSEW